jgi:site-specific DNA recombinase
MIKPTRCAIYTRKSSEEGLEQDFNSLDAQREACEAYIKSQKHEGWQVVSENYDDGGFSGGTLIRPALGRLLADIQTKKIDVVVVYKIDRLTRSLFDFSKIVEIFDGGGASFVSVTQQFNTTTSMGRLTLNVLLSFAQFEREVTGERIRDKIAASKKKGMWMGGVVPLGYEVINRELCIREDEAPSIRQLYDLYLKLGTVRAVKAKADELNIVTRGAGGALSRGHIHRILTNPIYAGKITHKKIIHDGLHKAIISSDKWDRVQQLLQDSAAREREQPSAAEPSPLVGKLFESSGTRLTPTHAVKAGRRYRYYISNFLIQDGKNPSGLRLSAPEIEGAVASIIGKFLNDGKSIAALTQADKTNPSEVLRLIDQAKMLSEKLAKQSPYSLLMQLKGVIDKAVINFNELTISLKATSLLDLIRGNVMKTSSTSDEVEPGDIHIITTQMRLGRSGNETRLILQNRNEQQRPVDKSLLRAIARGYAWRQEIMDGKIASVLDISKRENIAKSYVSRMMDLSLLSPAIISTIAEGTAPVELNLNMLRSLETLPVDWQSQHAVLGFNK